MSDRADREQERKFRAEPSGEGAEELLRRAARSGALDGLSGKVLLEALLARAPQYAQNCYFHCSWDGGNVLDCDRPKVPRWCKKFSVGGMGICLMCCAEHGCTQGKSWQDCEEIE